MAFLRSQMNTWGVPQCLFTLADQKFYHWVTFVIFVQPTVPQKPFILHQLLYSLTLCKCSIVLSQRFQRITMQIYDDPSLHSFLLSVILPRNFLLPLIMISASKAEYSAWDLPPCTLIWKALSGRKLEQLQSSPQGFLYSQGSKLCAAYCPKSENMFFNYFVQFYNFYVKVVGAVPVTLPLLEVEVLIL